MNDALYTRWRSIRLTEWFSLFVIFYLLAIRICNIGTYDLDLEGVEFANIHFVQFLSIKGRLYTDAGAFPYLYIVYTPLYYYLMLPVMQLLSIDVIHDMHAMYITGRTISLTLLFVDFGILYAIVRQIIPQFRYAIYLLLFWMLFLPVHFYTFRPDSFKVTFFLLFVLFTIKFIRTEKLYQHLLGFLFLLIAILFKQDVLAYGVILYASFWLIFRKWVYFFSLGMLPVVLCGMIYGIYAWSGVNLYKQLFIYNIQYDTNFLLNARLIAMFFLRSCVLLIPLFLNLRSDDKLIRSISVAGFLSFLVATLFMMRMGANMNYTYEASVLLLVNGAILLSRKKIPELFFPAWTLFLLLTILPFLPLWISLSKEAAFEKEFYEMKNASTEIKKIVGSQVVFLPDQQDYIFYATSNLIYGYDWHYDRYCELNLNIRLKPKFIKNDIVDQYDENFRNGTVQFIIVKDQPKSDAHIKKYYPHFSLSQKIRRYLIYRYKS